MDYLIENFKIENLKEKKKMKKTLKQIGYTLDNEKYY